LKLQLSVSYVVSVKSIPNSFAAAIDNYEG
jgi:hypothetical protein